MPTLSSKPVLMGIVNCTPDSFSDGVGDSDLHATCVQKAIDLVEAGATCLDFGGESTRPGADEISVELELTRVIPVIEAVQKELQNELKIRKRTGQLPVQLSIQLSVDTRRAEVAKAALATGVSIINDVSAGTFDQEMIDLVVSSGALFIATHSRGTPQTMMSPPYLHYQNVVEDVSAELRKTADHLIHRGIRADRLCLDPGFGFAKSETHSRELLRHLDPASVSPYPMLISLSRKGFLGSYSGERNPALRDVETVAALARLYLRGFRFFRVHDVAMCRTFFSVFGDV